MDHQTTTCDKCGAVLHAGYRSKHNRFHSDVDDMEMKLKDVEAIARRAVRG